MIKCISHKKLYLTEAIAEDALIEARTHFDYASGKGPVAVYQCEDCGYYHLTSRGNMNKKLAEYIAGGKLGLEKEANRWLAKIKGK